MKMTTSLGGSRILSTASPRGIPYFAVLALLVCLGLRSGTVLAEINVWTSLGPYGVGINAVAVDHQDATTVYAGTGNGLYKSTDAGASWVLQSTIQASELAVAPYDSSTVYAVNFSGMFKSTDAGASWSKISTGGTFGSGWPTTLAIDPKNPGTVYATTQEFDECGRETLHKTVDGGVSWAESTFKDLGVSASCVLALVIDPQSPTTLYTAFEQGGVFKSTDAGANWSPANSGLIDARGFAGAVSLAIDQRNPRTLYAVSVQRYDSGPRWGVFKSIDGGASWNPANFGLPEWAVNTSCCHRPRMAIDPQDPRNVYLGAAMAYVHRVFRSTDSGASWVDSGYAVSSASLWFAGLAAGPQGILYAGTPRDGVFVITFPPAEGITEVRFDRSTVVAGTSYLFSVSGSNLTSQTFFDVRFTAPGSTDSAVVLNWQRGFTASHIVPVDTAPGSWTINAMRAHEVETDHSGSFIPVSATITVSP
jgi:photosystem II stability/assembly factor-like uncharacterized protein